MLGVYNNMAIFMLFYKKNNPWKDKMIDWSHIKCSKIANTKVNTNDMKNQIVSRCWIVQCENNFSFPDLSFSFMKKQNLILHFWFFVTYYRNLLIFQLFWVNFFLSKPHCSKLRRYSLSTDGRGSFATCVAGLWLMLL